MNLNYTIYYPLTEKYIALYPNGKHDTTDPESELQKQETKSNDAKPPLWSVVEKCMEEKTLDLLREGKLYINANGEKIQSSSSGMTTSANSQEQSKKKEQKKETKAATQKDKYVSKDDKKSSKKEKTARNEQASKQHEASQQPNAEDEDDSDGGFFE